MNSSDDRDLIRRLENDVQAMLGALAVDEAAAVADEGHVPPDGSNSVEPRYEVESKVAEGGLGAIESVTDRRLMRTVARKRQRADAPPLLGREIRILSRLQHPNILPLYEAHFADDGQADGYTMPLLNGESLRDQARRFHANRPSKGSLRLSLAPLLSSFGDVCRAIGYAHSRGVWHLDLKGSNVLVDASGAAVVIDWNMALTDEDTPLADHAPGTPGFQAPEQASREMVSAATDVHGLGALLYQLLTGRAPYGGSDRDERVRRAQAGSPEPPSAHWDAVPRGLEAICRKAMATDPRDRYPSPEELWIDVDRWRNDESVACFREPRMARLARWVRRHPGSSGILLTLLLATLPALLGWLLHIEQQRRITAAALEDARASFTEVLRAGDRYFTTMSSNRLLQRDGLQPLRQELLADGLAFYREFLLRRGDTPELRREIAIGWARLAWLLARDESRSGATPTARRALQLLDAHMATEPPDWQVEHWKAKSLLVLADGLHDDGQAEPALAVLCQFDQWLAQVSSQANRSADIEEITARAQMIRASIVADRDPVGALPMLTAARSMFERMAANEPIEENQLDLASLLTTEASLTQELGQLDASRQLLSRAGDIYRKILKQPDPLPKIRRGLSTVAHLSGLVELEARNYSAARRHLLSAYKERQKLAVRNPDNKYLCHEASTAVALARLYRQTGPSHDSEAWLLRAHDLLQRCIDDRHPNSHLWASALETHTRSGCLLLMKGQLMESLAAFRCGCDIAGRAKHSDLAVGADRWATVAAWGRVLCEMATGNRTSEGLTMAPGQPIASRPSGSGP